MSLDLLRCPVGHTFDIARHGYVGLLTGTRATSGDDVAMVRARGRFLSTGAYAPIRTVGARLAAYVVLNVFAPRNPAEFHRVLRPTGRLIVIRPTGRHLAELRGRLPAMVTIDPAREQRLHRAPAPLFEAAVTEQVEYSATLTRLNALDLVAMTPSARHVSRADLNENGLLPDQVTVSVLATTFQPR
ncbi:hypothetical protein ACIREM_31180 [Streptomyces shenzhenensis]|uniref:hypothetical protein n=1 Tax=Streptomyces shenzhenensis TaxID=943815 RepID=UPI00382686F7